MTGDRVDLTQALQRVDGSADRLGLIVIDHGSRRATSNAMLEELARQMRAEAPAGSVVAAAHMELAAPSLADAWQVCVSGGAEMILVVPFFLLPGRHWTEDLPRLAADAAASTPSVRWMVTAPLGLHPLVRTILWERAEHCLRRQQGADTCDVCSETEGCSWHGEPPRPETLPER